MADAVQLASALTSLIGATCVAINYLKKLCDAQTTARDLYKKVTELASILDSIKPVVEQLNSPSFNPVVTEQTQRLQAGIRGCFEGCQRAIDDINHKLGGFGTGDKVSLKTRFRVVFAEKAIQIHHATIEGHVQSLQLSLIALNGLCDNVNHNTTHQFLRELAELLAYFIVLQHQARPVHMGMRTQGAAAVMLPVIGETRTIRMLPAIEEPERNLDLYFNFNPVNWAGHEPLPVRRPVQQEQSVSASQGSSPRPVRRGDPFTTDPRSAPSSRVVELELEEDDGDDDGDDDGNSLIDTPLAIAVKHNQSAVVEALIREGQDVTITDAAGWTLLHHAAFERASDALKVLLESKQGSLQSFKNAQNIRQQTALMLCAQKAEHASSLRIARMLIEHGADVNIEDSSGRTVLWLLVDSVAIDNREAFAELLVSNGANFGISCRRVPRTARDYEAVREMAIQFRRTSSAATIPENPLGSSPDSPILPSGFEAAPRKRMLSFTSIKRRFSGDPGTIGSAA